MPTFLIASADGQQLAAVGPYHQHNLLAKARKNE